MQKSAELHESIGQEDEKWRAISFLGYTARGLGRLEEARHTLYTCLEMAINKHAFNPLFVTLPAVALMLMDSLRSELAIKVYTLASSLPLFANSIFFEDLAGREIKALARTLPENVVKAAQEKGNTGQLWNSAATLLDNLRVMGWKPD